MTLVLLLSISLAISYFIGMRQKDVYAYLIVLMSSYFFTFAVMCIGFLLLKFNGNAELIFPDEMLYATDATSELSFSYYVRFLNTILDLDIVRWINISVFSVALAILTSEISFSLSNRVRQYTIFLASLGTIVGGYWSFFILKEAFSVAALSMLIIAYVRKSNAVFIFAGCLLFFARPELLALYIGIVVVFYIKSKFLPLYYLGVISVVILFVMFMNSELSYSIKLFTLSRRFGEADFKFDDIAVAASHLPLIPFVLSEPFRQAIITNVYSTFNPLLEPNPLVILQRVYNIIGFIMFLICMKSSLLKDKLYTFVFIIIVGVLCTHSVYRYLNTILIPFTLYFIHLKWSYLGREVNGRQSINNYPSV